MKTRLQKLFAYQELDYIEARQSLLDIAAGEINEAQIAAFLTVYQLRPITVQELQGFRAALLELCRPAGLEDYETMDVCGTGGDGKNTFNISTLTAFVVAGAGYQVAKHGNYGVSSRCGSSNVMEHLGYRFSNEPDQLRRQLDSANICFLHAPLFHPAMKVAAPIRRALGFKTFFNMLGPLVNPARPAHQLVGVFSLELARLYKYLLQQDGRNFSIVHSLDGYDEVSLTGPFRRINNAEEGILVPADLDQSQLDPVALHGGETIGEAADIFMSVLRNEATTAQKAAVLANATLAIQTRTGSSLEDARAQAQTALESGKALQSFQSLLETATAV
ncbi:MAG: anthranilate phosphoribosyltransferase [Bacteroidota bacterium]